MKLVRKTRENIVVGRPEPTEAHPQHVCLDKGYDYQEVRDTFSEPTQTIANDITIIMKRPLCEILPIYYPLL